TRANLAGSKVWARVVCTPPSNVVDAQGLAASAASPPAKASSSAAPLAPSAPPGASAGRAIELRAGDKVLAKVPLGPNVRAEGVAIDLPADAPQIVRVGLTGEDAIAEDDEAPVVAEGGALPMAVVADAPTTRVVTGGPPPI